MASTTTVTQAGATTTLITGKGTFHDDDSTIVAASSVVGFILVGLTGLLLFLKTSRWIRIRQQNKRFAEWNAREHKGDHPKGRLVGRYNRHGNKGKNAFDIIEEDEGIPA
ncbi:hypothetical protein P389DRAFT_196190 [Cystobasidium minutum MCA 4210]|uniref:uncharacterized protein n=1 Tax=Cystobasidium minutum MCA 4210 TaxID=1397322 RepID=UPI0034CEA435|eukprot:jgi/Rhomi1/196190/gm1.4404_g